MKKRICSILILLAILATALAMSGSATEALTLTVANQTANPGDTISVTISVSNNTGLASLKFDVAYDDALTLTGVTFNSAFGSMITAPEPYRNPEPLTMISPFSDITANGVFATLTFTVNDNAKYGHKADITISYKSTDICDGNYNEIPVNVVNGYVTVLCPHTNKINGPETPADCDEGGYTAGVWCNDCEAYISGHKPLPATGHSYVDGICTNCGEKDPNAGGEAQLGDLNGDTVIDLLDLSEFAVALANSELPEASIADMNGDGIVDLLDYSDLAVSLAG